MLHSIVLILLALLPTGTLPVVYVNTQNHQSVDSKEVEVPATIYITASGDYAALGSQENQLDITIRGRGNYTWSGFDKKPYKVEFNVGQRPFGLHRSRHWALLAAADDRLGFLKNTAGFYLSKIIGLPWTPDQVPVELVLNGDYKGLYFWTETVRVENHRVEITQQQDNESNPSLVSGGWLVEIDNYYAENNFELNENNGQHIMFTPHSPDTLSQTQRNYLAAQLQLLNDAIYGSDEALSQCLDIRQAAAFYLVQEIMEDCESYHGSCFFYKDRQESLWHFGPVWDFGNSYDRHRELFIYEQPSFAQYWIGNIAAHDTFQVALSHHWYAFRQTGLEQLKDSIADFVSVITKAAKQDAKRWKNTNVRTADNMAQKHAEYLGYLDWRMNWLYSVWGEGVPDPEPQTGWQETNPITTPSKVLIGGKLFIQVNGKNYTIDGRQVN